MSLSPHSFLVYNRLSWVFSINHGESGILIFPEYMTEVSKVIYDVIVPHTRGWVFTINHGESGILAGGITEHLLPVICLLAYIIAMPTCKNKEKKVF